MGLANSSERIVRVRSRMFARNIRKKEKICHLIGQ